MDCQPSTPGFAVTISPVSIAISGLSASKTARSEAIVRSQFDDPCSQCTSVIWAILNLPFLKESRSPASRIKGTQQQTNAHTHRVIFLISIRFLIFSENRDNNPTFLVSRFKFVFHSRRGLTLYESDVEIPRAFFPLEGRNLLRYPLTILHAHAPFRLAPIPKPRGFLFLTCRFHNHPRFCFYAKTSLRVIPLSEVYIKRLKGEISIQIKILPSRIPIII